MTNLLTKVLGDTKECKAMEARANVLPRDYRIVYSEMKSYMWNFTADDGMELFRVGSDVVAVLEDVLGLFETSAAQGKSVLDVTGDDVAAFRGERLPGATPSYLDKRGRRSAVTLPRSSQDSSVLTIGQLASYAGVTVRAVRHYHAKGLMPEPERDHSG